MSHKFLLKKWCISDQAVTQEDPTVDRTGGQVGILIRELGTRVKKGTACWPLRPGCLLGHCAAWELGLLSFKEERKTRDCSGQHMSAERI